MIPPVKVSDVLAEAIKLAPEQGLFVEFGVGSGASLRVLASARKTLGFDSFKGLPEDWRENYPKGIFACEPPNVPNADLVIGLFDDTAPSIVAPCALIHVDCDIYSSSLTALRWFKNNHVSGAVIVFDEFFGYPGCEEHEQKALIDSGLNVEPLFSSEIASTEKAAFRVIP